MARLNPPSSSAVVDVPETLVDQYVAQGWSVAMGAEQAREKDSKPAQRRPRGSNK